MGPVKLLRDNRMVRDIAAGLVASALWVAVSQALGGLRGPWLLLGTVVVVFVSAVAIVRVTRPERRVRRLIAVFSSEPSASKAGDTAVDILGRLASMGSVDPGRLADLAQRRRHPLSRFLDGIDAITDRNGDGHVDASATEPIERYLDAVRTGKAASREQAVRQAADQLRSLLHPATMVLIHGYSTVVCEALRAASPSVPVFIVRDMQYGARSSLGEHTIVSRRLSERGIEGALIDTDQISTLLDPGSYRLRTLDGASMPLPDRREIVALIGCEAADRSGRVLIPATVRAQPSETAWFVAEFARARQRGEGASISAQLVVVGESFKVFDDLAAHPELRTTSAPVAISVIRRLAYALAAIELPRGIPVELVEIGPDHIDVYIDDAIVARTRGGVLRLDASYDAWNRRVGTVQAPTSVTTDVLLHLLGSCRAIFVDVNGVLVDDEVDHFCAFAALSRTTADRSLPIDVYLATCAGRTDAEGVDELRRLGFAAGRTDELVTEKQEIYRSHSVPMGEGHRARLHRLLGRLGAIAPLVLVTASDRSSVMAALGDSSLVDDHFSEDCRLFGVESTERVSAIADRARNLGVEENRQCVVIDDSERNLAELRRRGYRTVGVSGLISERSLPADAVVRDLVELGELLQVG
jgi:beta-phosphoglucomutase-like phosphatase (HAD superfamily)